MNDIKSFDVGWRACIPKITVSYSLIPFLSRFGFV